MFNDYYIFVMRGINGKQVVIPEPTGKAIYGNCASKCRGRENAYLSFFHKF
jgi:hypothetical protein